MYFTTDSILEELKHNCFVNEPSLKLSGNSDCRLEFFTKLPRVGYTIKVKKMISAAAQASI